MSDTPTNEPTPVPADDDGHLYVVAPGRNDCAVLEGEVFPRRRDRGERGLLIVDRPARIVYLLDADDDARVWRGRERRPMAGDPTDLNPVMADGSDHVVRAALESEYDVIAAPWAGAHDGDPADDQPGIGQIMAPLAPGWEARP